MEYTMWTGGLTKGWAYLALMSELQIVTRLVENSNCL